MVHYKQKAETNESLAYFNVLEGKISDAYAEAVKDFLRSEDDDLRRLVERYKARESFDGMRFSLDRLLKRKIFINDVAEYLDIDFDSLEPEESEDLKDTINYAISTPMETAGKERFSEIVQDFVSTIR